MVTMVPVLERWVVAECPLWAVEPGPFYPAVPRTPTPGQVGALAWALIGRVDGVGEAVDAAEAVDAFLACDDDHFSVPGGLRITSDEIVVEPGCCFGLEDWRDWLDVLAGEVLWLGHSPDVQVEQLGPVVRVWRDEDLMDPKFTGPHIDIPRDTLPDLLEDVRRDLLGFLAALDNWAHTTVPTQADRLVATVDRRLAISPPLNLRGRALVDG